MPDYVNYPHNDPMYQGNHWNHPFQNRALAEADSILVIDSDALDSTVSKPSETAPRSPLSTSIRSSNQRRSGPSRLGNAIEPMRRPPSSSSTLASIASRSTGSRGTPAPPLLRAASKAKAEARPPRVAGRRRHQAGIFDRLRSPAGGVKRSFSTRGSPLSGDRDHMARSRARCSASGGGSLGWTGGAAIGMKLAAPRENLRGPHRRPGSYMFSAPSAVHWMRAATARRSCKSSISNRGWKAAEVLGARRPPDGFASRAKDLDLSFDPPPDYSGVAAAAGGAYARVVKRPQRCRGRSR